MLVEIIKYYLKEMWEDNDEELSKVELFLRRVLAIVTLPFTITILIFADIAVKFIKLIRRKR